MQTIFFRIIIFSLLSFSYVFSSDGARIFLNVQNNKQLQGVFSKSLLGSVFKKGGINKISKSIQRIPDNIDTSCTVTIVPLDDAGNVIQDELNQIPTINISKKSYIDGILNRENVDKVIQTTTENSNKITLSLIIALYLFDRAQKIKAQLLPSDDELKKQAKTEVKNTDVDVKSSKINELKVLIPSRKTAMMMAGVSLLLKDSSDELFGWKIVNGLGNFAKDHPKLIGGTVTFTTVGSALFYKYFLKQYWENKKNMKQVFEGVKKIVENSDKMNEKLIDYESRNDTINLQVDKVEKQISSYIVSVENNIKTDYEEIIKNLSAQNNDEVKSFYSEMYNIINSEIAKCKSNLQNFNVIQDKQLENVNQLIAIDQKIEEINLHFVSSVVTALPNMKLDNQIEPIKNKFNIDQHKIDLEQKKNDIKVLLELFKKNK